MKKLKIITSFGLLRKFLIIVLELGGGRNQSGMPLGNLTSQFFANIYLNELDYFVKHKLKAKYYLRYVDDFVILHTNKKFLEFCKRQINQFLKEKLKLELHKDKSKILLFGRRLTFLGFRIFYNYRLLKKSNIRKMKIKYFNLKKEYNNSKIVYDKIYDFIEGWLAYSRNADTFNFRKTILKNFEKTFSKEVSTKEINRLLK